MRILLLMSLFLGSCGIHAATTLDVFKKYPNLFFIETGSYMGDGIQMALEAGFGEIYSIELSPYYYEYCCERFKALANVHILNGDSGSVLEEILKDLHAPATFWLDGHYSSGNTARGESNTPILRELAAIQNHPIKTHTILIDDVRCFGTSVFDFIPLDEVIRRIRASNPYYTISFENGHVPKDVLVARP